MHDQIDLLWSRQDSVRALSLSLGLCHWVSVTLSLSLCLSRSVSLALPLSRCLSRFVSLAGVHLLSLVLVAMMKSKEFKTKISHAHSLILSLCLAARLVSLARFLLLGFSHSVSLAWFLSLGFSRSVSAWSLLGLSVTWFLSVTWSLSRLVSLCHLVSLAWSLFHLVCQSVIVVSQFLGLSICQCISLSTSLLFPGALLSCRHFPSHSSHMIHAYLHTRTFTHVPSHSTVRTRGSCGLSERESDGKRAELQGREETA